MYGYKECLIKVIYFFEGLFRKKISTCPYCLATNFKIVQRKAYVIDICHCLQCGLYWTNPVFRFYKIYDTLYSGQGQTTDIPEPRQLKKKLKSNYKGTDKDYGCLIEWLKENAKGRKLLEFGSSWGYFLYQAQKAEFNATGVELSKNRREFGKKKLNLKIVADLESLISNRELYDAIVTLHTIEHLTSIKDIFSKFNILLKEGGLLVIAVPFININKGENAFKTIGAVHPLGFCEDFFERNMPKEGFKVDFYDELIICTKVKGHFNPLSKAPGL